MPTPDPQTVVDWLRALSFQSPAAGTAVWTRSFPEHSLTITVDTAAERIDYGPEIKVHRHTVTNFTDAENFVVLECVCALLECGYKPSVLELEKPFPLGRAAGGYLDILVNRPDGQSYLMVECKTAGAEYEKELTRLRTKSTSQLLSYLQQDRGAEHAVLYSSRPVRLRKVERDYAGFATSSIIGNNTTELFRNWDKQLYTQGLLDVAPYTVDEHVVRVKDLRDLTNADGQALFNLFKETLRRHAVSDLPNAFNKLFNLFICKILDEDKVVPNQPTEFQWGGSEDAVVVLERLSRLYERGMREYLKLDVADSGQAIADVVTGLPANKAEEVAKLVGMFRQYSNTDFAFIDVYDRYSYDQNAAIVRDLVRLLQNRRLRYTQKHGFMGMFFERLLHTSMKQEAGQFFTPPPIAQFVNEALPVEDIVREKIAAGDALFLPYGIDYAAGSGHFLTEYMDRVFRVLRNVDETSLVAGGQKTNLRQWKDDLSWAGKFVYGLELDYRLAKTAKVSTFLHGDGEANVIRANGLASFSEDSDFLQLGGRLTAAPGTKDRQKFDVVVANPPYSVSGFAEQLPHGANSFDLWAEKGERSDDIECFFIERTKQLLVDGGVAGVVLPTSILTNTGIEARARRMLVRYFDIVGMAALGERVFIATDTPCVVLFLRRRSNAVVAHVTDMVSEFLRSGTIGTVLGVADAFERYADAVHGTTPALLHVALAAGVDTGVATVDAYEETFKHGGTRPRVTRDDAGRATTKLRDYIRRVEQERMEGFLSTLGQRTVVVQAPSSSAAAREFLGYSFSERRRHEGIRFESGTDEIHTPLFNPADSDDADKISTLIKAQFAGDERPIPATLSAWVNRYDTLDLLGLEADHFDWRLRLQPLGQPDVFALPTLKLRNVVHNAIGATPPRERPDMFRGTEAWVKISDIDTSGYPDASPTVTHTSERITAEAAERIRLVPAGTLLMSFKLTIGHTAFAGTDLRTNEAIVALTPRPRPVAATEWVDTAYIEVLLRRVGARLLGLAHVGAKKFGRTLNLTTLRQLPFPVADDDTRARIIDIDRDGALSATEKEEAISAIVWGAAPG